MSNLLIGKGRYRMKAESLMTFNGEMANGNMCSFTKNKTYDYVYSNNHYIVKDDNNLGVKFDAIDFSETFNVIR